MKETKVEAKTIQDAVEIGLMELGLRRDQVEVAVLNEGSKGFLGIGAKKACVQLREKKWTGGGHYDRHHSRGERSSGRGRGEGGRRRDRYEGRSRAERNSHPRPSGEKRPGHGHEKRPDAVYQNVSLAMEAMPPGPEDPVEHAKTAFTTIIKLMGLEASVTDAKRGPEEKGIVSLRFDSPDSALFTQDNARGLQSLQSLLNSIVNRNRKDRCTVRLDTADYWARKEEELASKVETAVKEVIATARPHRLEPMSAPLRKYVHNLIQTKYPGVETLSEGEGKWRKVVIRSKPQETGAPQHQDTTGVSQESGKSA